jgi:hypothetical protein
MEWIEERTRGAAPPLRNSHRQASYASTIVVYGGRGTSSVLDDVWTLNYDNDGPWKEMNVQGGLVPPGRENHALFFKENTMVVFGMNHSFVEKTALIFFLARWK